jgi:hypothetical protein
MWEVVVVLDEFAVALGEDWQTAGALLLAAAKRRTSHAALAVC